MARLTGTTKTIINDYYKEIIRRKENERCDIEKNYCLEVIEQFNQDSDVLKVKELLVSLDYLPKNSKEYKQAVTKLNNIIKGE